MNITLSTDERIIETARAWAAAHGTSVNALVRDFLAALGTAGDKETAADLFSRNAREGAGRSIPETDFTRRGIYRGTRFGTQE